MDTKSLSRVEHVERVEGWKKVERFMAGWSATEMPRQGVRPQDSMEKKMIGITIRNCEEIRIMAWNAMKRDAGKTIQDKTSVLKYVANSRSLFLHHDKIYG